MELTLPVPKPGAANPTLTCCVGPAPAADSYLRINRIVESAQQAKVWGIHPGYGFLAENPAFARTCGFTIGRPGKPERQSDVPSLRKLQQFDQLMTANGLWEELAVDRVAANLREGKIKMEDTLVHDTTHYYAYSSKQMVELPRVNDAEAGEGPTPDDDSPVPASQSGQPVPVVKVGGGPVVAGRVGITVGVADAEGTGLDVGAGERSVHSCSKKKGTTRASVSAGW